MRTARTRFCFAALLLVAPLAGAAAPALTRPDAPLRDCAPSEKPPAVQARAAQGHPVAQFQQAEGHLAALGCLMRQDAVGAHHAYRQARLGYQRAAAQGYGPAQVALGQLERTFGGAPRAALSWFQKAAEQGCVEAYYTLGQMYAEGQGVAQDTAKAYRWYALAAGEARLALLKAGDPGAPRPPCSAAPVEAKSPPLEPQVATPAS